MTSAPDLGPVALTLGDPAGIGPELSFAAWRAFSKAQIPFFIVGDADFLAQMAVRLNAPAPVRISAPAEADAVMPQGLPVLHAPLDRAAGQGVPDAGNAEAIIASIKIAVEAVAAGDSCAVVTNPISKSILYEANFKFPGHTEFLAALTESMASDGAHGPIMMLTGGGLRVALATIHTPLAEVPGHITIDRVAHAGQVLAEALRRDFRCAAPRIAVTGLNPHAGENGALGTEEIEVIAPAIARLQADGVNAQGPFPADTIFRADARAAWDGYLAMYHDQGLIPVKTLDFHGGVNVTLGLPIVRTSPDHGAGFDIAGKDVARADSLIAAIKLAREIATNRALS